MAVAEADWASMQQDIENTDWETVLVGDAEDKAQALTSKLLSLQQLHVPSRQYLTRPTDPTWFGYRCRAAAEAKHAAWVRYKRHPSHHNKLLHREACKRVTATCQWAVRKNREDLKKKLTRPGLGNKAWWTLVKERQGVGHQDAAPPLTRPDGSTATNSEDKASLLAELFAKTMTVDHPERLPPRLPQETHRTVTTVAVTREQVEKLLKAVEVGKATGPDHISPRVLKHCARELSGPLSDVFTSCVREKK